MCGLLLQCKVIVHSQSGHRLFFAPCSGMRNTCRVNINQCGHAACTQNQIWCTHRASRCCPSYKIGVSSTISPPARTSADTGLRLTQSVCSSPLPLNERATTFSPRLGTSQHCRPTSPPKVMNSPALLVPACSFPEEALAVLIAHHV